MSYNDYDWLGPGVYFWESNPQRGMEFAREASLRRGSKIAKPFVVGAIIELGSCLDLTTSSGIDQIRIAHQSSLALSKAGGWELPRNSSDGLRRYLDCAVIRRLHGILDDNGMPPIDSVKGIFRLSRLRLPREDAHPDCCLQSGVHQGRLSRAPGRPALGLGPLGIQPWNWQCAKRFGL